MILLFMVLYPYSSGAASWSTASNPTRASINAVDLVPPQITPGPEIDSKGIFARANIATCGYISGNAASPLTCPESYICSSAALYAFGWSCCNQIQCQGNYFTCADYGGRNPCAGLDDSVCKKIFTSILYCSSNLPSCVTYARSKSLGDLQTDLSLGCGTSPGTILALVSTTAGGGKAASKPTSTDGGTTNSASNVGVTLPADGSSSSNAPGPTPDPTSAGSSNGSSSKKLSIGEIAAIVIPIVAMIAAIIVGWWKRHQVTWLLTCGAFGYRHSNRPVREAGPGPYVAPLAPMPSHANYGPIKTHPDPPPSYTVERPFLHPNQSQHSTIPPRNPSPYQNFQASQPFIPMQPQNQPRPPPQGWIPYDGMR